MIREKQSTLFHDYISPKINPKLPILVQGLKNEFNFGIQPLKLYMVNLSKALIA